MMRHRWKILIAFAILATIGAALTLRPRKDDLDFLRPYVVSETTTYEVYAPNAPDRTFWRERDIVVKGNSEEVVKMLESHLTNSTGWKVEEYIPSYYYFEAYKGVDANGLSTNIVTVTVEKDVVHVSYNHMLTTREQWWIRVLHLGRDPFKPVFI